MPAHSVSRLAQPLDTLRPLTRSAGRIGVEHRLAEHHRRGLRCEAAMKAGIRSAGCWPSESMVSAWVKPCCRGQVEAVQHGRALAAVFGQHQHAQAAGRRRHRLQACGAAVGAAVHHHPHRRPLRARGAHRFVDLGAGVVAGDQHQMGGWRKAWVRRHQVAEPRRIRRPAARRAAGNAGHRAARR